MTLAGAETSANRRPKMSTLKIQKLDLVSRSAPSRPQGRARVWRTIGRKRNACVAEHLAKFARVDDADAILRIR